MAAVTFKRRVVTPSCLLTHILVMRSERPLWERHWTPGALKECPWSTLLSATLYSRYSYPGPHATTSKAMLKCYPLISKPGLNTPGNMVELGCLGERGIGSHFPRKNVTACPFSSFNQKSSVKIW